MSRTALIAGAGDLPAALVAAMAERPLVCALDGFLPAGLAPDQVFRIERLVPFLRSLEERGVSRVAFAGAVRRPRLDPALFDAGTAQMVPQLLAAMQGGDDATLRAVIAIFEEAGLEVVGAAGIAPHLVPGAGVLAGDPGPQDRADAARAAEIAAALGALDVGQGCVVAQGLCLGAETLAGTDAMLSTVAALGPLRPRAGSGRSAPIRRGGAGSCSRPPSPDRICASICR
jgi:UDP-2,3-diacylglucosamine hydrolase